MTDWGADRQRRAEDVWRRAERLGAFLEVGRTIQVGDEVVELVATLADAAQTVVAYRAPVGSHLFPSPLFGEGGASGGVMGDLLVAYLPPAEGSTVLVDFGRFDDDGGHEVELPIDRARTRAYERRSVSPPAPLMVDGVRVAVQGAAVGLLDGTVDVEITSNDQALVAATLGSSFLPHPHRRAGSGPLWRDWFPPSEPTPTPTRPSDDDGETGDPDPPGSSRPLRRRIGASATATARFMPLPEGQRPAPTPPPTPGQVRALPGGQVSAIHGWSTGGGPIPEALSLGTILRFDPLPDDASALELLLDELFIFRRCEHHLVEVPGPRPGEPVDLSGRPLVCDSDRIALVRWEPREHGCPLLVVRPSRSGLWPDIRVVAGDASTSLWLRPTDDDELAGGLPGMYNPLFAAGRPVTLGLRMLGRRANVPPITIPLTPAQTP